MEFILAEMGSTAKIPIASAVRTDSNLTSAVFKNIASSLDIDLNAYETKFHLIDSSLVDRRNKVAHGEFIEIDGKEFSDLVDEVITLMRHYKTDLENAASVEAYKRAA